ncbi:MAG: AI-2E family transporter [Rubrimonas sp.]|uniref:AI-2E family transporter n=1 Tax=Rubrimonas sp. TaxID=2036015 RepID=UPI002FDD889E
MQTAPSHLRDLVHLLALAVLLAVALYYGRPYLAPIAVAVLIWFLINALADALRARAPRVPGWAATLAAVATLFGLMLFVARIIAENAGALSAGLDGVEAKLLATVDAVLARFGLEHRVDFEMLLSGLRLEALARDAFDAARALVGDVVLVFLYVMFLLVDQRFYVAKLNALVPDPARRAALRATLRHVAEEVRAYLWLMTLISAGVGVATWAICLLFGVSGAGFWGFLAFGLNFIPTIGSILAVTFPVIYALLQVDSAAPVLAMIAMLAGVQFLAGEIVLPRVMGDRLNMSGFVILLSLVVWGALWGPVGMFLAIPIMVILMIVFAQFPATRPIAIGLSRAGAVADAGRGEAALTPRD